METKQAWIVVEWNGERYVTPDDTHGGTHPGPFESEKRARDSIALFAESQVRNLILDESGRTTVTQRRIDGWRTYHTKRHRVVSIPHYPCDDPKVVTPCSCGSIEPATLDAGRDGYPGCPNCGYV